MEVNYLANKRVLNSFVNYCNLHTEERFWQALKNWSKFGFILKADNFDMDKNEWVGEEDTYNFEGKDE